MTRILLIILFLAGTAYQMFKLATRRTQSLAS